MPATPSDPPADTRAAVRQAAVRQAAVRQAAVRQAAVRQAAVRQIAVRQIAVRQIAVPAAARALSMLPRIDYEDAFVADVGPPRRRTAEHWARTVLERAPADMRRSLLAGWSAIGLEVDDRQSGQRVLGWQIRQSTSDYVLLGADSSIGLPGELLFQRHDDRLLLCTFVHQANPAAHAMWAKIEKAHLDTVRRLLEQASQRTGTPPKGSAERERLEHVLLRYG